MKRVFAILLAMSLFLTLAACGKRDTAGDKTTTVAPTTTTVAPATTQANTRVDLVTAYETDTSASMGSFSMHFTYESDYRGGTMVMKKDGQEAPGTFTCDENYNINHMQIDLEKVEAENTILVIDCTFDDAHRILSANLQLKGTEKDLFLFRAEYGYDTEGRKVYSKVAVSDKYVTITSIEYREDGQVLRQRTELQINGATTINVIGYEYDEEGRIQAMVGYDLDGTPLGQIPATHEVKEDGIHYTIEADSTKTVLVVNDKAQIVLQESYSGDELISRIKTEFDDAGRAVRLEQWVAYTNATTVITYVYTADGRLQESKQVTGEQEIVAQRTTFQTMEIPA